MIVFRHIFLLLIYIFPATSFSLRFLFEASISLIRLDKIKSKYVFYSCLLIGLILVLLHIPKLFLFYGVDSFANIIRVSSVLVALFYLKGLSFKEIYTLLASLIFLNVSISLILFSDSEIGRNISSILNVKNLEETYGRVAGLFHNVSVNSYFSYVTCIYFFCCYLYNFKRNLSLILFMLAFVSLVMAQSRTGMILLIPSLTILFFYIKNISLVSFMKSLFFLIVLSQIFFYFFEDIASSFYFIRQLSNIYESGGVIGITSLSARFDLWEAYLGLQVDSVSSILFGLDKSVMSSISNTFDNDFIWILVNFGVFGIIVYLVMLASLFRKVTDLSGEILRICCIFSIPFSFMIGVISQPQASLLFLMFFVNVRK